MNQTKSTPSVQSSVPLSTTKAQNLRKLRKFCPANPNANGVLYDSQGLAPRHEGPTPGNESKSFQPGTGCVNLAFYSLSVRSTLTDDRRERRGLHNPFRVEVWWCSYQG